METNYKRQAIIYICFLICIIVILLILPLYSIETFDLKKSLPESLQPVVSNLLQFFYLSIVVLIFSMIIVAIFI